MGAPGIGRDGRGSRAFHKTLLDRQFATFIGTSEGRAAALIDHGLFSITAESGTDNATTQ